jgi:DNA-binding transcriptional LysR family regulator
MDPFRYRLGSPDALVVFQAAARHLNFTEAAADLGVTQAAVSRRVRGLEDRLGLALFDRSGRRLALTPAGHELYDAVVAGLSHILDAAEAIRRRHSRRDLRIAANNAMAFFWLQPRLSRYLQAFPDVEVQAVASDRDPDLVSEGLDLAIRYGDGAWPGLSGARLFAETVFPVCAPSYATRFPEDAGPCDLLKATLLHMIPRGPDWITWPGLLQALDVERGGEATGGPRFNNFPMLIQAALDGQGVAIGTHRLLDGLLSRGDLVRPVEGAVETGRGYHLVWPAGVAPSARTVHLRDWLIAAS